ncbi:hypothetical protein BDZ91DRAFT_783149 [Kalaharituber pfeilii]|nr:hypothetical protein BDZ91DRAFT_783149 [Kalaharituber pfeilii]
MAMVQLPRESNDGAKNGPIDDHMQPQSFAVGRPDSVTPSDFVSSTHFAVPSLQYQRDPKCVRNQVLFRQNETANEREAFRPEPGRKEGWGLRTAGADVLTYRQWTLQELGEEDWEGEGGEEGQLQAVWGSCGDGCTLNGGVLRGVCMAEGSNMWMH